MAFTWLALAFVLMPMIELALMMRLAEGIGWQRALIVVIVTGVVGAALARSQGLRVLRDIQRETQAGRLPAARLLDGVMILVAGVLLITPGLLTDGVGLGLLVPPVRSAIRAWLRRRIENGIHNGRTTITFRH